MRQASRTPPHEPAAAWTRLDGYVSDAAQYGPVLWQRHNLEESFSVRRRFDEDGNRRRDEHTGRRALTQRRLGAPALLSGGGFQYELQPTSLHPSQTHETNNHPSHFQAPQKGHLVLDSLGPTLSPQALKQRPIRLLRLVARIKQHGVLTLAPGIRIADAPARDPDAVLHRQTSIRHGDVVGRRRARDVELRDGALARDAACARMSVAACSVGCEGGGAVKAYRSTRASPACPRRRRPGAIASRCRRWGRRPRSTRKLWTRSPAFWGSWRRRCCSR